MSSIAKRLVLLAFVLVLTLAIDTPTRIARAQSPGADAVADGATSEPDTKGPPVIVSGCYQGNVFNDAQGTGTITFFFHLSSAGKILKADSTYDIEYDEGLTESGPISGKANATQFKWKGPAVGNQGSQCKVAGIMRPAGQGSLNGNYIYSGKCREVAGPHNPFTGGSMSKLVFTGPVC